MAGEQRGYRPLVIGRQGHLWRLHATGAAGGATGETAKSLKSLIRWQNALTGLRRASVCNGNEGGTMKGLRFHAAKDLHPAGTQIGLI